VDTLTITRQIGRYAGVVEADSKQDFDPIDHAWMVRMVAERIDDGARRRLRRKGLKAGGRDADGQVRHPVTGPPHGGTVAPVLAHVVLHSVLEGWLENVVQRPCRGDAGLMRDADDFGCAFEHQAEAERCYNVLGRRREKCGLGLSGAKTRLIPFSRHHLAGKTSFEWLGFECRGGQDRTGQDRLKRRTARQKLRTSRKRVTAWCQESRHRRLPGLFQRLNAKRRG